jgi:hypothetical protein
LIEPYGAAVVSAAGAASGWHHRLHKLDRIVVFPSEVIMLYRMATLLRGLSLALRYNVGVAEHWRGAAQKLLDTTVSQTQSPLGAAAGA